MSDISNPSVEHLLDCSQAELQDAELKFLNMAANCRKRAAIEHSAADKYIELAAVLRWLINNRDRMFDLSKKIADGKQRLLFADERETEEFFVTTRVPPRWGGVASD